MSRLATALLLLLLPAGAFAGQSGPPAGQAPPAGVDDRRPAMPGVIDDSSIGTRVGVRIEAGTDLTAPDRAEFLTAKCGCYASFPTNSVKYDPAAPGPGPGIVSDANIQQLHIYAEYAPGSDQFSLVADVPVRWFGPQSFLAGSGTVASASGLGDVRFGAKFSLSSHAVTQTTVQVMASAPTGDAATGLGVHHWTVEPAILYAVRIGKHASIETELGTVFPFNGSAGVPTATGDSFAGRMMTYAIGPSVDVYSSSSARIAPVVELRGWHVLDGYSTTEDASTSGLDIVNVTVGARAVFGGKHSLYVGWEKAITDVKWFDRTIRVEYRWGI